MLNLATASNEDIVAQQYDGMTILKLANTTPLRRVLYLNSYGMASAWRLIKEGLHPGQHLWGCLELVRMGYEIAMPEVPRQDTPFFNYRRQDLRLVNFAKSWLGRNGIVYSGHTILFWIPLLASLNLLRCPVVSMLYARGETIRFAKGYRGLIALTPAAKARALALAPQTKTAHLSWGVDLSFFSLLNYSPKWFLACGKTLRDFDTLAAAAALESTPIHVINTELPQRLQWPSNVKLFTGGQDGTWVTVSYKDLLYQHYAGCFAALITLQPDPHERFAAGLTQLLEAMAMARPVIVTRTGALAGEIDVEKEGCGLFVPPNNPAALAAAMRAITDDPVRAEAMGLNGRRLCETRYSIDRYAGALHQFFQSL